MSPKPIFEQIILGHLDASYNLARWLLGNEADAHDVVQTAALRAMTYFDSLQNPHDPASAKAWLLGIVRNCSLTLMRERSQRAHLAWDDLSEEQQDQVEQGRAGDGPDLLLERKVDRQMVNQILASLPVVYREVLILRDMEEMSYDGIAHIVHIPIGTVMSRLARARQQFRKAAIPLLQGGHHV